MEGMSYHGEQPIDFDQLREQLRKMTDEQFATIREGGPIQRRTAEEHNGRLARGPTV